MVRELKIFSGTSNPALAQSICDHLGVPMGLVSIRKFPDAETFIRLEEDIRGRDIFVIQSVCHDPSEYLVELLIYLDCIRRASALRVTAVLPYYGYARQDRKDEGRTPITAKLVANMLSTAGADRVLTVDLHAGQIQGFFDIPLDHLEAQPVFLDYFGRKHLENLTVVSPDLGSVKRAHVMARHLAGKLAIVDKERVSSTIVRSDNLIGAVDGGNVVIYDDIISTAGSVCEAARVLRDHGARDIYVSATHGVLCGPAAERLNKAPIKEVIVSDTVPLSDEAKTIKKLKVLSVATLLGEAIRRIHHNESVSSLFFNED